MTTSYDSRDRFAGHGRLRLGRSGAYSPHPCREIEECGPVVEIGVAALVLAEGDAPFGAGLADLRIGIADQAGHAERAIGGGGGPRRFPRATRIDPGVVVEIAGAD